jgi:hypothetical protein
MARVRFITGAFEMVLGFFVYEYGLFLTLNLWPSLSGWTLGFLPWMLSVPAMGAALQLIGGVLSIIGLLSCIVWVGSQPREKRAPGGLREASAQEVRLAPPARLCRFCGTAMGSETAFCPKCQRAQA